MNYKTIEIAKKLLNLEIKILDYSNRNELRELVQVINAISYNQICKINRIKSKITNQKITNENKIFYVSQNEKTETIERISKTRINFVEFIMMDTVYRNIRNYKTNKKNNVFCTNIDRIILDELVIEPCMMYSNYAKDKKDSYINSEISLFINENRYYLLEENNNIGIREYLKIRLSIMRPFRNRFINKRLRHRG
jgi:hypothetical protein